MANWWPTDLVAAPIYPTTQSSAVETPPPTSNKVQVTKRRQCARTRRDWERAGAIFSWRLGAENVQVHVLLSRQFGRSCAKRLPGQTRGNLGPTFLYTFVSDASFTSKSLREHELEFLRTCNPSMLNKTLALTVKLFIILFIS